MNEEEKKRFEQKLSEQKLSELVKMLDEFVKMLDEFEQQTAAAIKAEIKQNPALKDQPLDVFDYARGCGPAPEVC